MLRGSCVCTYVQTPTCIYFICKTMDICMKTVVVFITKMLTVVGFATRTRSQIYSLLCGLVFCNEDIEM